jgi:hypothetical protein
MFSLRSAETQKKEFDLQAEQTVRINLELQKHLDYPDSNYRSRVEDMAVFANVLREWAPADTTVLLHARPEIILSTDTEDYSVAVFMSDNCWRFKVNGSVHYELETEDKLGPTRALKKLWDSVIPRLPENFIIRGVADPNDPPAEAEARNIGRKKLGFSDPQANREVYGIVREGKVNPLTLDEFLTLTGTTPDYLTQKFSVRKINWPGA